VYNDIIVSKNFAKTLDLKRELTSMCDFTNSAHPVTMITIRHYGTIGLSFM